MVENQGAGPGNHKEYSIPKKAKSSPPVDYFQINDLKNDLKKRAIRGGGITVLSRVVTFIIQTMTTMVLARILAPEEFGLVAMVTAVTGFLTIFMDLGLTDAIIQKTEINQSQISNLFWINIAATLFIILIIGASSPLIARLYSEPRLIKIAIIWPTYLLLGALTTQHIALLKRRMQFSKTSMIDIFATLISSLLAIVMALHGGGYWALVFRQIFYGAFGVLGAWILCKWRPELPSRQGDVRSMLAFGRNATGSFIFGYFSGNLDKILIGSSYGASQLGFYHHAYYLFALPSTQLTDALKNVATSTLSKLRTNRESFISYYLKAVMLISFIGMPVSFFLMIEGEDIVLLLLGSQWKQTVVIFRILSAGMGILMIYSTKYWLHASLGRSERLLRWGIFDFVITAIAVISGLRFGPQGVAIAYTAALYALTGFGIQYAGKPIGLKFLDIVAISWRNLVAALLAAFVVGYVFHLYCLSWGRIVRLMGAFIFYCVLYLILLVSFHRSLKPITNILSIIRELIPMRVIQNGPFSGN